MSRARFSLAPFLALVPLTIVGSGLAQDLPALVPITPGQDSDDVAVGGTGHGVWVTPALAKEGSIQGLLYDYTGEAYYYLDAKVNSFDTLMRFGAIEGKLMVAQDSIVPPKGLSLLLVQGSWLKTGNDRGVFSAIFLQKTWSPLLPVVPMGSMDGEFVLDGAAQAGIRCGAARPADVVDPSMDAILPVLCERGGQASLAKRPPNHTAAGGLAARRPLKRVNRGGPEAAGPTLYQRGVIVCPVAREPQSLGFGANAAAANKPAFLHPVDSQSRTGSFRAIWSLNL